MGDLYGKCGCNCGKCAAYIENIKSEEDKQKCSDGWKKFLNIRLDANKCVCLGCQAKDPWKSGGMLPNRACIIRGCAERSGAKTCANCFNFPCDFLKQTSGKYDYTRAWVEKRVGEKLSEEEYEIFVKCFETFKNVSNIRKNLSSDEILPKQLVEPLKVKVQKFPEGINLLEDKEILKATYDLLVKVRKCECKTYIQQVINEKRLKPTMMTLWVFARYGEVVDKDVSKLVILSEAVADKEEFRNIIRKKDNYLHGSAQQVAFLLKEYGFNMDHTALPHKQWKLTLSVGDDIDNRKVLSGLKMFCEKLVESYGEAEPLSAWKLKGEAFKKFENINFDVFV